MGTLFTLSHKRSFYQAILLIIQIARCDWPDRYPDFYSNILTLVTSPSPSTAVIGLLFIQTASEELGTPRDNVLSSRKAELKQRLLQLVPQTLSVLTGIEWLLSCLIVESRAANIHILMKFIGLLESIWEKQSHSITSTPPPSPTNPTVNSVTQNFTAGGSSGSSLNSELDLVVQVALQCLTHLFSWIPLSSHVTPQLMELIFRYVGMGTQHSLPKISTSNGNYFCKSTHIHVIYQNFFFLLRIKCSSFGCWCHKWNAVQKLCSCWIWRLCCAFIQ